MPHISTDGHEVFSMFQTSVPFEYNPCIDAMSIFDADLDVHINADAV